jgi:hypothetical protein
MQVVCVFYKRRLNNSDVSMQTYSFRDGHAGCKGDQSMKPSLLSSVQVVAMNWSAILVTLARVTLPSFLGHTLCKAYLTLLSGLWCHRASVQRWVVGNDCSFDFVHVDSACCFPCIRT